MSESIVKASEIIRKHLRSRFVELNISNDKVAADARLHGIKLHKQQLSKYFNNKPEGFPSDETLIFLCFRYGIDVHLNVKLLPYDEIDCLKKIAKYF